VCLAAISLVLGVGTDIPGATAAEARVRVTCEACLLVDDGGRTLFARRPHEPRANASTTKMLTALVVRRRARPDDVVTVSAAAAATGGGGLDLHTGERFTVESLLRALLLTSSNDAAVALAEHVAGSETAFVAAMNARAVRMGLRRTHAESSHGLDRPGHFASAADLARVAGRLLRDPLLASIVGAPRSTIPGPAGPITLENRNVLLETYSGAIGVKTGYTDDAGDVLVAAARRAGRLLIAVAMGSDDAVADCRRLLDLGFARLRTSVAVPARAAVGWLVFDPAGATLATTVRAVRGPWRRGSLRLSFDPDPGVRPPVAPGEGVGTIVVAAPRGVVTSVRAVSAAPLPAPSSSPVLELLGDVLRWGHELARRAGLVT
jgi:D-alanyl-D-alanine carboxypeptidase (penicillin-binding protein 5/6)